MLPRLITMECITMKVHHTAKTQPASRLIPAALISFCLLLSATAASAASFAPPKLKTDNIRADYIVITPAAFVDTLQPLLDHRSNDGLAIAVATTESIYDEFSLWGTGAETIRAFVSYAWHHWKSPAPSYLLIVGDAPAPGATTTLPLTVPTGILPSIYKENADDIIASDSWLAEVDGDGIPDLATGRLPADNTGELSQMIAKTIAYETETPLGLWKSRTSFFASTGGFGTIDQEIEKLFKMMVRTNIGPMYNLNMTYANIKMPYFYTPEKFNDKVIERFNEGSLLMTYIGHGLTTKFDSVKFEGKKYPIITMDDVARIDSQGRMPILTVIACLVGNYDYPGQDSIGEALYKNPKGPSAVIAASVISQPYPNAVLAKTFSAAVLKERVPTVGIALLTAKHNVVAGELDAERRMIDRFGRVIYTVRDMVSHNWETIYMYNLMGDPAMKIALPKDTLTVFAPASAKAGATIKVKGFVPGGVSGEAYVSFECFPGDVIYPIAPIKELKGEALYSAIEQNYANANNKVAWERIVGVKDGEFSFEAKVPDLKSGEYYIRAYATTADGSDALGATAIKVENEKPVAAPSEK